MIQLLYRSSVTAMLLMLASGCAMGQKTRTQKSSDANTAQYRTYRWITEDDAKTLELSNPKTEAPAYYWAQVVNKPDTSEKVRNQVEKDLQSQGYKAASGGSPPDFYITYYARAPDETWMSSWSGRTPGLENIPLVMYPDYSTTAAKTYRDGMALIVIYDGKSHKPVWQGNVLQALSGQKVNREQLASEINQLIVDFRKSA